MSHHIKPSSVDSYLSGISNQLEHAFPQVRTNRKSPLVSRTLAGCKRLYGSSPSQKLPLGEEHLLACLDAFPPTSHDNLLFRAILLAGFLGLHRLGELVWPDSTKQCSWRKIIQRASVVTWPESQRVAYLLPTSKTDHIFEGSQILIDNSVLPHLDFFRCFTTYFSSCDNLFPIMSPLWLTATGDLPTRHWFLSRLQSVVQDDRFSGHSIRSGGATFLAASGWPDDHIQTLGRWSSASFKIYIRKHLVVLQALLHGRGSTRL